MGDELELCAVRLGAGGGILHSNIPDDKLALVVGPARVDVEND